MKTKRSGDKLLRVLFLVIVDVLLINFSSFLSVWVRFDFNTSAVLRQIDGEHLMLLAVAGTLGGLIIFAALRLYTSLWSFAGFDEMVHIAIAAVCTTVYIFGLSRLCRVSLPRSFLLLNSLILFLAVTAFRFSYRYLRKWRRNHGRGRTPTMIVGAGQTGDCLLRELQGSPYSANEVVCLIDDDPKKIGKYMHGVKVVGGRNAIPQAVQRYDIQEIIVAMPTVSHAEKREILTICQQTGCAMRIMPGLFQLANGEVRVEKLRQVEIEDLLGRESVAVDWGEIARYVQGQTVLVTGGGGSIGSELCRQIARHNPKRLVLFDIYENNAYAIQQELLRSVPSLNLTVLIGSVRDEARVNAIFEDYEVDLVYHAAAHKHVPLMEDSPGEAVKNNIFGTRNVAQAAGRYGVKSFVMISTDKAVNPTNVMGASKRVCEMVVQQAAADHPRTTYASVRFGNVLGSNGSVIPLFRKQIEAGGPVTVTSPDIIRYFMTIPEAVSLVLQAGALAKGGEVFVLDMGEPVKIDDLARNMIRLSGLEPDVDIPIVYTGLRPGEKLYEELLTAEEGQTATKNRRIFVGRQETLDETALNAGLQALRLLPEGATDAVRATLKQLVPTFHPSEAETAPVRARA